MGCKHSAEGVPIPDEIWPSHFVECLTPEDQRKVIEWWRDEARAGRLCRESAHQQTIDRIGTDAGVDDAIRASYRADGDEGLITGWVVLASVSSFDADGTDRSGVHRMFPDGSLPWVQALGIVEAGRIAMHKAYANGAD